VGATAITTANAKTLANEVCTTANTNPSAGVTALCPDGQSVIIVQASYAYTSPFAWVIPANFTFTDTAISRPRYVTYVQHS
jgi:hypothetical protein